MCRICEPIAFMSIFPYIYYMIEDFHITEDPNSISVYAGMVTSAFTLAEFSTGVLWGRLSDRVGRKPILLMGLGGTGLSVLIFGFAQSLPVALFARTLGGLLNGYVPFSRIPHRTRAGQTSTDHCAAPTETLVFCKPRWLNSQLSRSTSVSFARVMLIGG